MCCLQPHSLLFFPQNDIIPNLIFRRRFIIKCNLQILLTQTNSLIFCCSCLCLCEYDGGLVRHGPGRRAHKQNKHLELPLNCTSSITISAALRTDSMTSPLALHTPTCPGVSPLRRAQGAAPDRGLERGSLATELRQEQRGGGEGREK